MTRIVRCCALIVPSLASACDPVATVLDTVGGPTSLCTDLGNNECRRPNPDDLQPS